MCPFDLGDSDHWCQVMQKMSPCQGTGTREIQPRPHFAIKGNRGKFPMRVLHKELGNGPCQGTPVQDRRGDSGLQKRLFEKVSALCRRGV
ncbi:hypothetical protein BgiMline_031279 [Biomphalaria glabrata]|nr:hypothetical protein BgiMline_019520 [Biomphalaria glabrata]